MRVLPRARDERLVAPGALRRDGPRLEESVDIVSELAYGDAGVAFTLFISIPGTTGVLLYGSDELKDRYLTPLCKDGAFCATLGSERMAGSELTKIATMAARAGEAVVINGDKFFSTNASFAHFLVVFARWADKADEHVAVLVPGDRGPRANHLPAPGCLDAVAAL